MIPHQVKVLEVLNKVGVHSSSRGLDLDTCTLGSFTYIGDEFVIGEEMDRLATVKENQALVEDGTTLLKLSHSSTAVVIWPVW